jgi:hypothetical protein
MRIQSRHSRVGAAIMSAQRILFAFSAIISASDQNKAEGVCYGHESHMYLVSALF